MFLFTISAPQKPLKKLSQVFEKGVASDKYIFTVWNTCSSFWHNSDLSFFFTFLNILVVMFSFYGVSTQKYQNIITGSLNRCDILYTCLRHLQYVIRFPTFWIFIRSSSLFTVYAPQKPPKYFHRSLKEVWRKPNLPLLFKIPILSYMIFAIFANIFEAMFGSDAASARKNT